MDQTDLRLFLHLCDTLHFGRTSRECHISPSTLSRIIKRLEEEASSELLQRDRRGVQLTTAGECFRRYAKDALESWKAVKQELGQDAGEVKGEISLYCSVTASYSILPDILSEFRSRYPEIHIRLVTGDANLAIDQVVDKVVDISVAPLPESLPKGIDSLIVTHTPLVFIVAASGSIKDKLKRNVKWGDVPMIFPETGLIKLHLRDWFRQKGIVPLVYGEVSGHEGIVSLVSLGLGVGVVPRLVLEKSLIKSQIEVLDVRPSLPDLKVGFCTKKTRMKSAAMRVFWETLSEISPR